LHTPEDIDSLMSSEFPTNNDDLLELIKSYMVHRPCGVHNSTAPCMANGACSKGLPKPFREETSITEDSYARTRRRNTRHTYRIGDKDVDNQWVICYSPYLTWKYRCHINVESIASVKAVKYIYKYVYKGHDRTTMQFGRSIDEIKLYLDARYISSCEAMWHLYLFDMQEHIPAVVRLQVHLPNEQPIIYRAEEHLDMQAVLAEYDHNTTLTAWFKANEVGNEDIRNTLYQNFSSKMV